MPSKIAPELLKAIQTKLGIGVAASYKRIADAANRLSVTRQVAALDVAASAGVNINRYASEPMLAQLQNARRGAVPPPTAGVAQAVRSRGSKKSGKTKAKPPGKHIWIVHGRDERLRRAMFDFVRSIGLKPLEWSAAMKATRQGSPYVGAILDKAFAKASAVIVLMTPDDTAQLKKEHWRKGEDPHEKKPMGQARPNVLFEAGIAFGTHPHSTILVEVGKCRPFSDTQGRHVVRMNDSPERRQDLIDKLTAAGCLVEIDGRAWMEAGDFSEPDT